MTPEAKDYLDKAQDDLEEARKIAGIGLAKAAARSAYYAAFHAAEAFIVERTGQIAKTHSGVRSRFAELAKSAPGLDKSYSTFLAQAYKFKEIGDYGIGLGAVVTTAQATDAIESATHFLEGVRAALTNPAP